MPSSLLEEATFQHSAIKTPAYFIWGASGPPCSCLAAVPAGILPPIYQFPHIQQITNGNTPNDIKINKILHLIRNYHNDTYCRV
ncbi:hypothetical protein GDO78_011279 [Eleutherodactylus coqui]|uniref:Uncharacterized protein n=1 Tax=Eleutherodactylus coqui TaxID=57060 RepID=A0A8J6F9F7_ELECQ|nr:hypothetical protein GDO78_011279 [Eleutherodactylus coqui]